MLKVRLYFFGGQSVYSAYQKGNQFSKVSKFNWFDNSCVGYKRRATPHLLSFWCPSCIMYVSHDRVQCHWRRQCQVSLLLLFFSFLQVLLIIGWRCHCLIMQRYDCRDCLISCHACHVNCFIKPMLFWGLPGPRGGGGEYSTPSRSCFICCKSAVKLGTYLKAKI